MIFAIIGIVVLTIIAMVYASVTTGDMSSTAPTGDGGQIQRVGVAKSADILFFNPSIDVGEI